MITLKILDIGLKKYSEVLHLQQVLFIKNVEAKIKGNRTENYLLLCEHEPVYTLGKSGKPENILIDHTESTAEFYHIDRGGDVTFHGPGQLVVYPILDLDTLKMNVARYIFNLEETVIEVLKNYNLTAERVSGAAGVWLGNRKIAAIGAKVSRHITMHGLAVNLNTDLSNFSKILACGLEGKGTTSLQKELGKEVSMEDFKKIFIETFGSVFSVNCQQATVN